MPKHQIIENLLEIIFMYIDYNIMYPKLTFYLFLFRVNFTLPLLKNKYIKAKNFRPIKFTLIILKLDFSWAQLDKNLNLRIIANNRKLNRFFNMVSTCATKFQYGGLEVDKKWRPVDDRESKQIGGFLQMNFGGEITL